MFPLNSDCCSHAIYDSTILVLSLFMYLEIHFWGGYIVPCVLQNMINSVIYSNNVMRSHRHCCYGQSTMHYLSALELHVTVNSTKALNVVMGTQEWI